MTLVRMPVPVSQKFMAMWATQNGYQVIRNDELKTHEAFDPKTNMVFYSNDK